MANFDLVIRGGTVVTASDSVVADVGVKDGVIEAVARNLGPGTREIGAGGLLVLPGGVDSHCHIEQKSSIGMETADDFYSGTASAACGGTTTIMPFAPQMPGQSLRTVVQDYRARGDAKAVIDYAVHLIVSDPTEQVLGQELPALIADGYTSFKIYMTYDAMKLDDRQILEVLAVARREGALVMVHAENNECLAYLSDLLIRAGHTEPRYHATARPMPVEREATHRVISLAEVMDVPILIVHVSGIEAAEQIRWAKTRGLRVYAETCPQYLFLSEDDLDKPGLEGAKFMCSPPPRDKGNQEKLWRAIQTGLFDVFSSDHAPYRYAGTDGKLMDGPNTTFKRIANGVPGLEVRLPLLFHGGVGAGRIDLGTFVALTSTNPAKMYGLHPRKGTIAVGSDADIAIWDAAKEVTITHAMLHDAMDYTPYEGMTVKGWPVITISRGDVVCENGELTAAKGRGLFLPCAKPASAAPSGRLVTAFNAAAGRMEGAGA